VLLQPQHRATPQRKLALATAQTRARVYAFRSLSGLHDCGEVHCSKDHWGISRGRVNTWAGFTELSCHWLARAGLPAGLLPPSTRTAGRAAVQGKRLGCMHVWGVCAQEQRAREEARVKRNEQMAEELRNKEVSLRMCVRHLSARALCMHVCWSCRTMRIACVHVSGCTSMVTLVCDARISSRIWGLGGALSFPPFPPLRQRRPLSASAPDQATPLSAPPSDATLLDRP